MGLSIRPASYTVDEEVGVFHFYLGEGTAEDSAAHTVELHGVTVHADLTEDGRTIGIKVIVGPEPEASPLPGEEW